MTFTVNVGEMTIEVDADTADQVARQLSLINPLDLAAALIETSDRLAKTERQRDALSTMAQIVGKKKAK